MSILIVSRILVVPVQGRSGRWIVRHCPLISRKKLVVRVCYYKGRLGFGLMGLAELYAVRLVVCYSCNEGVVYSGAIIKKKMT